MKGICKHSGYDAETYGIVKIAPGKFECYIDPALKENEPWETDPDIEDYTMTSFMLDE